MVDLRAISRKPGLTAYNMVFTLGLPRLATRVGLGTISRSSDIVRFVYGGVVKRPH